MSTKLAFLISGLFHILFFSFYLFYSPDSFSVSNFKIFLKKGGSLRLTFSFSNPANGRNSESTASENPSASGTLQREIEEFKNEIHFPQGALEQRLESDCSWEVEIKSDGKAEVLKTVQPCRYSIFETEFKRALKTWKFNLKEGTNLIIPVSFKVDDKEF
ncbi:hypothetical protein A0128_00200 [Leptospira tipperaryensis]|uniref:TonB C-terminal domain-containing protein n=1 Tax=Leptospira tipperaryensis TaxID=2564040 RepID=A0A1D7US72_9LEPT|nr:energy transducer TonB [Leptospira tipperaryensis]AOP32442.1 hypothetical protein A0128_00200 [Leptospira tipperaryensis]